MRSRCLLASVLTAVVLTPGSAAAAPGDILVVDPAVGVIRVDPLTGSRTLLSANGAPAGGPSFVTPIGITITSGRRILVTDLDAFPGSGGGIIEVDAVSGARTTVSSNAMQPGGSSFDDPRGIVEAADGSLLVADSGGSGAGTGRVLRVNPDTGILTTVSTNGAPAGGEPFEDPSGIAVALNGDLLVVDSNGATGFGSVIRVDPVTGARTLVSAFNAPAGAPDFDSPMAGVIAANGDLLVADFDAYFDPMTSTRSGSVIRVDPTTGARSLVSSNAAPTGGPSFQFTNGIALTATGNLLVTTYSFGGAPNGLIAVDPGTGARTGVSLNGAPAGTPTFSQPFGVAVEPAAPSPPPPPPPPPPPAPPPAPPPTTTTTSTPAATTSTQAPPPVTPADPPVVAVSTSAADLALACTTRRLVLVDVLAVGGRVQLIGAADRRLAGQTVAIRLTSTGKRVATAKVAPDGSFSTTAPLPPTKIRLTDAARYQAVLGAEKSLNLKLARRMIVTSLTAKAGRVTIAGRVVPPLAKPAAPITLLRRLSCTKEQQVSRFKPRPDGSFKVTVPAPPGQDAAVYRLSTRVRRTAGRAATAPTFTLPRGVNLTR